MVSRRCGRSPRCRPSNHERVGLSRIVWGFSASESRHPAGFYAAPDAAMPATHHGSPLPSWRVTTPLAAFRTRLPGSDPRTRCTKRCEQGGGCKSRPLSQHHRCAVLRARPDRLRGSCRHNTLDQRIPECRPKSASRCSGKRQLRIFARSTSVRQPLPATVS